MRTANNSICGMGTIGVSGGTFSGSVNNMVLGNGDYKVYVADYEGGSWATAEVTVTGSTSETVTADTKESSSSSEDDGEYVFKVIKEPTRTVDGYGAWVSTTTGKIDKNHPGTD